MKSMKGIKKGVWVVLLVLGVMAFMVSGALAKDKKVTKKQFDIESLLKIDNPQAEFKVDLWTDREDGTYKIGDRVTFFFKTDRDCRVTLLNVGTDGKVQILFPNDFFKDNLVKAGTTYTIPPKEAKFAIKAKAPAGEDAVKAIATLDKVVLIHDEDIVAVKGASKGFKTLKKNPKTLAVELEEKVKPMDPKTWAEANKVIKIVPNIGE